MATQTRQPRPQGWRSRIIGHGEEAPDQLLANPRNWRIHPKAQQDALSGLLDEVGWVQDVIVNKRTGHVVDGHLRVSLAISREEWTVPVVYVDIEEAEEVLVLAALDPLAAMAGTDRDKLADILGEAETNSVALEAMLASLGSANGAPVEGKTDPDDVPAAPAEAITKPGDIWLLGEHRLMCGDATSEADVARLLDGAEPFLMVTDPPYGVEYDPEWRTAAAAKGLINFGTSRVGKVNNDGVTDWSAAFRGDVVYVWHSSSGLIEVGTGILSRGYEVRAHIIWRKASFAISRGHYHWQHEPCWYAVRKGATAKWTGDRSQSTVWDVSLDRNVEGGHSTQKPVEIMERPIRNHGDKSDAVYDPFVGSGTTIIAAERQQRRCYAMEIDPLYVDVAVKRWENFTGRKAVLG